MCPAGKISKWIENSATAMMQSQKMGAERKIIAVVLTTRSVFELRFQAMSAPPATPKR